MGMIEHDRSLVTLLRFVPPGEGEESWADRLVRLRGILGISQQDLAKILNVSHASIFHWESGKTVGQGCIQRVVELLELRPEEAAIHWPGIFSQPEEWTPERIDRLRESLNLDIGEFAELLRMGKVSMYAWQQREPGPCARFLLWLLESEGPPFAERLRAVPDEAWPADRVVALRESLGFTLERMSTLLGVTYQTIGRWEVDGLGPRSECQRLLLSLLEVYPRELLEYREKLPRVL